MRRFFLWAPVAIAAVFLLSACSAQTMGATNVTASSADLHATAQCDQGQSCTWYWEYWPASQPRSSSTKTPVFGPAGQTPPNVALTEHITGLQPNTAYRWVFCGSPNNGGIYACAGPNGKFDSTTADPPSDYDTFTTAPAAAWTVQTTPNPTGATNSQLSGVSCTSATACTAVGYYNNSAGTQVTLAEGWDGTAWTVQTTPNPTGATNSQLSGVSCTSATACTAVGYYQNSANAHLTLAEGWDGTAWTVQTTPNPTGATNSQLSGVSCTSATACTAVGSYNNSAGNLVTLAERWDGTAWTVQTTPNPTGAQGSLLFGVSCTSATACTAAGYYNNSAGTGVTLAESWDGTAWTVQTTPNPTGATFSELSGVSCTSATACTAVGSYNTSAGTLTLAEGWDGTAWTVQTTPNPTGTTNSQLSGVSCTSATACTAAGYYFNSARTVVTLAARWDGTAWTVQTIPNPTGATFSGVSCTSATACTAVGYYNNVTLAESYSG